MVGPMFGPSGNTFRFLCGIPPPPFFGASCFGASCATRKAVARKRIVVNNRMVSVTPTKIDRFRLLNTVLHLLADHYSPRPPGPRPAPGFGIGFRGSMSGRLAVLYTNH